MFNRVAQREFATAHNITGNMSKSRKRFPAGTCCCCKSQKRGKQISHRKFRRLEHVLMHNYHFEKLPMLQYELTRQWDLGGDGKCFWGWAPEEEWFQKEMRKWGCWPSFLHPPFVISTKRSAWSVWLCRLACPRNSRLCRLLPKGRKKSHWSPKEISRLRSKWQ